jgi:hypothetical protein
VINRKRAMEKYNAAAGAERAALAGAGVDSYAEFLLESNAPTPAERDAVPTERDAAKEVAARARLEERTKELRARARALLGREPGFDVAGELRAHLVESPARAAHVEELAALLRAEGFADADDVIAQARAFLAKPPSVHVPQPPTWAMLVAGSEVPLAEIERIEQELAAKDEQLASLEVEAAHLVARRDADLLRLGPDDLVRVVGALFAAYRAGEVLEGHLPLVLDGVLDGLAADARDAAVFALAAVDDAQVIVVTDDEVVARRMSDAGGTIVRWPAPEEQRNRGISG